MTLTSLSNRGQDGAASWARTATGINLLLGLWFIIAPWVLHFGVPALAWDTLITGGAIVIVAAVRLFGTHATWPSWINVVLGVWLAISPWIFGGSASQAYWNDVFVGLVVALLAAFSAVNTPAAARAAAR